MNLVDSALDRGDAEAAWARLAALAEHRPPDVVGRVAHAVRAEVIGVAARLGVDAVVGRDAVRSRLAGTPKLLHIATHAGVAINGGWLAMADGRLSPGEVLSRRLRAGTVVLAGCASAAGPGLGGAGSIGSAFLAAGGRTVVATLRSVDDGATAAFVRALYAAGVETDAVAAVAIAQRQMIREMNREMIHDGASACRPTSRWGRSLARRHARLGTCTVEPLPSSRNRRQHLGR